MEASGKDINEAPKELVVITQFFSLKPEIQEVSAQTRVAAIALLFHAM
jgi:hypothetical protein